jgi:simple sugar transport system permease protein
MSEIAAFIAQTIRIAIPYLFAASGGVVAERAGVVSLTLEGFMLTGAFAATLGSFYSGSPWIGVLCGIAGGLLFGLIHAVASIRYRADQIVTGIAINLLAVGFTRFFLLMAFDSSSNSPRVPGFGITGDAASLTGALLRNPLVWLGLVGITSVVLFFH